LIRNFYRIGFFFNPDFQLLFQASFATALFFPSLQDVKNSMMQLIISHQSLPPKNTPKQTTVLFQDLFHFK